MLHTSYMVTLQWHAVMYGVCMHVIDECRRWTTLSDQTCVAGRIGMGMGMEGASVLVHAWQGCIPYIGQYCMTVSSRLLY
jgi:hypothetical protein